MNKLFTLTLGVAFLMTATIANAQSQRMGLVEEATQASCPPCATANPGLQTLMNANSDKTLFLAYQVWWPGFDQMYLDNVADIDERVGVYYDFGFAPQVKFNGSFPGDGGVSNLTQTMIDNHNAEMSEFDLSISAEVVNGQVTVTGSLDASMEATGDFKLHLVLTESTIYSTQATGGTNGETEYHHVMKKFLPGVSGIDLENSWADGDSYAINGTYDISCLTIYNWDDLEVIAFVQNDNDKFIHQAAKTSDVPVTLDVAVNAVTCQISGTPADICLGTNTVSPELTIGNFAADNLTSADIVYTANGSAPQTFAWTGNLEPSEQEIVILDPITFEVEEGDDIVFDFEVLNPNGSVDELPGNNTASIGADIAPLTQTVLNITITTDPWGDETYWEVRTVGGVIIDSGGNPNVGLNNINTGVFPPPFDAASYGNETTYEEEVVLPAGLDCYIFHITDYYGDGITGGGGFWLYDADGQEIHFDEENFNAENMKFFSGDGAVGLTENTLSDAIHVYPNPSSDVLNVSYNIETSELITFDLINALGAKVATRTVTSSGANTITFDVTSLESGVYQLNTIAGNAFGSTTVTIVK